MRNFRRFFALFLLLICLPALSLADFQITATFYPLYITALNITQGAQGVTLSCLASDQAGCLHDYQMTTADRRLLADTDVLIYNGLGLEEFLEDFLKDADNSICASDGIEPLESHGHDHAHEDDHHHEENCANPHVWVSPRLCVQQTQNIANALSQLDPDNAALYLKNAEDYIARLNALDEKMTAALSPLAGEAIVTFHEAFDYLARDYQLSIAAVVQTNSGSAPSPRELAEVVDLIYEMNVRALFCEAQYDDASVETLSMETGLPIYTLSPAVSGENTPDAYLNIMEENLSTLLEALK